MYSFYKAGKDISGKECMLIVCGASEEEKDFDGISSTYELMAEYLKWNNRGILKAAGVDEKGDVKNTPFLQEAEELGRNI